MIAFVIYNKDIIYTFEVPDFRALAIVTFAMKNAGDVANKYNLFDKLLKQRIE